MGALNIFSKDKYLSPIIDPFSKSAVESIWISIRRDYFDKAKFNFSGNIEFKMGNTMGKQEFNGISLEDCLNQIKQCVEHLR